MKVLKFVGIAFMLVSIVMLGVSFLAKPIPIMDIVAVFVFGLFNYGIVYVSDRIKASKTGGELPDDDDEKSVDTGGELPDTDDEK